MVTGSSLEYRCDSLTHMIFIKKILAFSDTGIGMTRQELVDCLGTIAQSGTTKFLKTLKVTSTDYLISISKALF